MIAAPARIGSLFSGIGGFELGLEEATGGRTVWQCEIDPFCRRVLAKHWPDALRFEDITTMGEGIPPVDIICGGFPCQDISLAGKGAGLDGARSGLFFELARIVGLVRPRYVVLENSPALIARGFGRVLGTLADLGYDAEWAVLSALGVGAPHIRRRAFVLAYAQDMAHAYRKPVREQSECIARGGGPAIAGGAGEIASLAHVDRVRELQPQGGEPDQRRRPAHGGEGRSAVGDTLRPGLPIGEVHQDPGQCPPAERTGGRPAQPDVVRSLHGIPGRLDGHRFPAGRGEPQYDWEPPRTIGTTPNRPARIKALGNAVVPQVAMIVGRRIMEIENLSPYPLRSNFPT